jgi:cupin fold WbuC family metalloprotein
MTEVKLIADSLFDTVAALAEASPRLRMNYNFHSGPTDNPHRFLNVLLRGTYIRPHRHLVPPKSESFLVLEGMADLVLFDDQGKITARYQLSAESPEGRLWGVDISPGVWHTIMARTTRVVCFEVKLCPWVAADDKEFAKWAPAEIDPDAATYSRTLLDG